MKLEKIKKNFKKDITLYLLLIPFILWFITFLYKPMYGLQIAFRDYSPFRGILASPWVGLENFKQFLTGPYFSRVFSNTVMIAIYRLVFAFPIPIILALLLNEVKNKVFKKTIQTATYLPYFISSVVIAGIIRYFLAPDHGLINLIIEKLGGESIYFLVKSEYFRSIFISMGIWKNAGYGAIVYLAALSGVNPQLYEAAIIDGANRWKQTLHVTIPVLLPTIVVMFILQVGRLMQVSFEQILLLYQPATYETADVIQTYVFRAGIAGGNYSLATTAGLFSAVISFALVFIANKYSKKLTQTSLW